MNCNQCNQPVGEGDAFCSGCGAKQDVVCTKCGRECAGSDKFCSGCGNPISGAAPESPPEPTSTGERRPLTVMFSDLVGSTELSSRVDAEDLMDALHLYQEMATKVIRSFGGHVAQYLGDGLLVYFGYPLANEDDPARAVHAALGILRQLPALNDRLDKEVPGLAGRSLEIRIGIHSGPVVVTEIGSGARTEQLATGDTVNLAARLEGLAQPNRAIVSSTTERLARGSFEFQPLGAHELKGFSEPVHVFQVECESSEDTTSIARIGEVLTPLVGRSELLAELESAWSAAREGKGQAFVLEGEAGIGKSRVVQVIQQTIDSSPQNHFSIQASSLHDKSAFHPLVDMLRRELGIDTEIPGDEQLAKLRTAMSASGYSNDTSLSLLAEMLSIDAPGLDSSDLTQAEKRVETLGILTGWMLALANEKPRLVVVEDLHWLDPSTLEWLSMFIGRLHEAPVLLVLTTRPSFDNPWADELVEKVKLTALSANDLEQLIREVAGKRMLPDKLVARLVERSGGIPLFAEELTRSVLESIDDVLTADSFEIPDTLAASLTSRLDRLGAAKRLAQLASVIGSSFSHSLLEAVSETEASEFGSELDTLIASRFLIQTNGPAGAHYAFQHALLQDTAYQSILHRRLRGYHARVAEIICVRFPDTATEQPEVIAHHFDEAGQVGVALEYYERAGIRATAQHANQEAIAHFRRGLELLLSTRESPERDHREIDFQIGLGLPLSIVTAYSETDVGDCYRRALELCRASEQTEPRMFEALYGLSRHHQVASELDEAVKLGEELLQHAQETSALDEQLAAHVTLAQNLYWQGKFKRSLEHARATIDIYSPEESKTVWQVLGTDPGVSARAFAGLSLWAIGDPEAARDSMIKGIELAQELQHRQSEAYATGFAAVVAIMLRDTEWAKEVSNQAMRLSDEPRLPIFWGQGQVVRGWARVAGEGDPAGIEDVQQGIGLLASLQTGVGAPGFMSVLAEVSARLGNHEAALGVTGMGIATAKEKGQPQWMADLLTVRGLSQLAVAEGCEDEEGKSAAVAEAEATLRLAVATASEQGARSLGLRAWIALSNCLVLQGGDQRIAEARDGLELAYQGFEKCSGQEHDEARSSLSNF